MKRGRPPEQPAEVKEKYTRVVKHSDGSVTTWFYDLSKTKDGPIKTETKYPKGMLDWGQVQESNIPLGYFVSVFIGPSFVFDKS